MARVDHLKATTARLYPTADERKRYVCELLWGDRVEVLSEADEEGRIRVRARGHQGFVEQSALGGSSLLELYFIDVGQGDGVLIRTPDDRHILVDGGYKRAAQPSGKNAADFVDWKFVRDYGRKAITLDAMISSHNDADHYGGLWDLLNPDPAAQRELDATSVEVKAFYHAGLSWLKDATHSRFLGRKQRSHLIDLLEDEESLRRWLAPDAPLRLQGEWGEFLRCVERHGCPVRRLHHRIGYLPGFEPSAGQASVRVLGPVDAAVDGMIGLKSLGTDSQNTNGHSVLLRVDYGAVRVLLTGDLNARSQASLMQHYAGRRLEFASDVVKACHHGSDDCSFEFLESIGAGATVISSGDAESHGHPRPRVVAASALCGHVRVERDQVVTPLVYSTEIARSYRLGKVSGLMDPSQRRMPRWADHVVEAGEVMAGALRPKRRTRRLGSTLVVTGLVYGLVNVRTDGRRIVCATLNEGSQRWHVEEFESRF